MFRSKQVNNRSPQVLYAVDLIISFTRMEVAKQVGLRLQPKKGHRLQIPTLLTLAL